MQILLGLFLVVAAALGNPSEHFDPHGTMLPQISSASYNMGSVVPARYSNFKTIVTEHFDIHYPGAASEPFFIEKNMEMIARLSAVYFEEGFEKLTKELNSKPYLRIQVVIVDNTDSHNGFATPVPQNTIYIYAIPPLVHTTISEYDNWLRETAFHELTHIINLSTTRGYTVPLRAIFGTVVATNGLSPLNFIEGDAVFEETNMTKKGRGRSTFLHTMMRTTAYEKTLNSDSLYSLSIAPYVLDRWPMGSVPYLYGYLLMEHVAKKYSLDVPGKISKHNAGVIPYYPSFSFEKFTGKSVPELWEEMLVEKREFYAKWIDHISKDGETKIEPITHNGFINRMPSLSPDGKLLAYYLTDPNRSNRIVILDLERDREIDAVKADDTSFIKWLDNNTIIFNDSTTDIGSNYYVLRKYDLKHHRVHSISGSSRTIYANVINEDELCTVSAKTGKMDLNIEKISGRKLQLEKTLYSSKYMARLSNPFCAKTRIGYISYFVEKDLDAKERLVALDDNGNKYVIYETNGSIKNFIVNKDNIVFIDDPDEVFNLYRLNLVSKKVDKLTNLISGSFDVEPADISGNNFYITYYTSDGFRIGKVHTQEQIKANNKKDKEIFVVDDLPIRDEQSMKIPEMEKKNYYGFKTMVPKTWVPAFAFVDHGYTIGGMTYGSDSLFRNQYFVSGAYDSRTKKALMGTEYMNQSFYPTYSISAFNDNTWFSDNQVIQELQANVNVAVPLNTHWSILTGLTYDYRTLDFINVRTRRYGIYGGLGFNDTATTISAISNPEQGVSGFLKYSYYPKGMSTYDEYEINANLKFYIPLWWVGHVIAINNDLGYAYGDPYMFYVTGGEQSSLVLYSKQYLLRGYPVSYFSTHYLAISNIEYRFPILTLDAGHNLFPIFFKKLHGAFIFDNGFLGKNYSHNYHSFGLELRIDGQVFYHLPVTLRIGLYKGTNFPQGQFFVGVSSIF